MAEAAGERSHRAALFGYPLGHSVSPAMHQAAAEALGVPLRYELWPLREPELAGALQTIREPVWLGANVTLPYKPAVAARLDQVTPLARRIGAVNTIYKRDGELRGENTDAPALLRCLEQFLGFQPGAERVLVLGAGGAARAAVVALAEAGVREIAVANRTDDRAEALLRDARAGGAIRPAVGHVVAWREVPDALPWITLLVNATSVGLDGVSVPLEALPMAGGARVYDLVYGRDQTPLVRLAQGAGLAASDGLWMLVYQAALAFELWTGRQPPEDVMYAAALSALRARP